MHLINAHKRIRVEGAVTEQGVPQIAIVPLPVTRRVVRGGHYVCSCVACSASLCEGMTEPAGSLSHFGRSYGPAVQNGSQRLVVTTLVAIHDRCTNDFKLGSGFCFVRYQ